MPQQADHAWLNRELARYLSGKRVLHSQAVAEMAQELARIHAPDQSELAYLAGLLHDNAKQLTDAELIAAARDYDINLTADEEQWPQLLHGKVGGALLPGRFGLSEPEVVQAVADHVTGRSGMGRLSEILFVADQGARDRVFPGVEELRAAAGSDLELACFLAARHKLAYVLAKGRKIAPATVELYNEYWGLVQAKRAAGQEME